MGNHGFRHSIIRALAPGNPVLFHNTFPEETDGLDRAYIRKGRAPDWFSGKVVLPLEHVIPVRLEYYNDGALLPLVFSAGPWWQISDAFGRFISGDTSSPTAGFRRLLDNIEHAFRQYNPVPLGLRYAFEIRLGCPVHLDNIGGISLLLPLALALLREVARDPVTGELPFGNVPVFCTGAITGDNRVGGVAGLKEKASAFLRECGDGLPAILPFTMAGEFGRLGLEGHFSNVIYIYRIADFWNIIPGLSDALMLAPRPGELDFIIQKLNSLNARLEFKEIQRLSKWLEPHMTGLPSHYRIHISLLQAMFLGARGNGADAEKVLQHIKGEVAPSDAATCGLPFAGQCAGCAGANERALFAARFAINTTYLMECEKALSTLEDCRDIVPHCTLNTRAEFWAAWGRVCYFLRDWEGAASYMETAIACADCGAVARGAQYRYYLARILITKAACETNAATRNLLLGQAATLLQKSKDIIKTGRGWAIENNHHVFFLYLESLIARAQGNPWTLPPMSSEISYPQGYNYVLLSCARNPNNTDAQRKAASQELFLAAQNKTSGLNHHAILSCIYQIYYAGLQGQFGLCREYGKNLLECLQLFKRAMHPGWYAQLAFPTDNLLRNNTMEAVEALCDKVPFF